MTTINVSREASTDELAARIEGALKVAGDDAMYDGEHHKQWVIDQMVRHLTGCPVTELLSKYPDGATGKRYTYEGLGESEEYRAFVGDDAWDEGVAP